MSVRRVRLKRFGARYPDTFRETAVKGLLRGVAAHHAGCHSSHLVSQQEEW
jgi:hypothetical protein